MQKKEVTIEMYYELLGRCVALEKKVEDLYEKIERNNEKSVANIKLEQNFGYKVEESKQISRMTCRRNVIEVMKNNPLFRNYNISAASREKGSGILVTNKKTNQEIKIKFYYSKTYRHINNSSWSGVYKSDLEDSYFYIFGIVEEDDSIYYLVFTKTELQKLIKNKEEDQSGKYHISFHRVNDRFYEGRSSDNFDVTFALDNYRKIITN